MSEAVTSNDFKQKVLEAPGKVLVDFHATWCGPCRMMAPALEEVASAHADAVSVFKLDIDQAPDIAREYRVSAVPTLILFEGGTVIRQAVGAQPKEGIEQLIGL